MAWTTHQTRLATGAALLLAAIIVTLALTGFFARGVDKLPVGHGAPAISIGQTHGVILASDGSLWSWGSDFLGWPVLGQGGISNQTRLRRIGRDTNWVGIAAGDAHNLAIKSDGTLWAWGQNLYGEFGIGTMRRAILSSNLSNVPVPSAPGNHWKQAAASGAFSVALKTDGTLWAWGNNWAGPLGIGSTSNSAVPVQVGSATNWVKVWAGILETVALQADGSLWYWGENPDPAFAQHAGQILVPTRVSPDTNWVDVGFGVNTEFALKSDGTLWAWGRNAHVYTGVTNTALDAAPLRVGTNDDWRSISDSGQWWCTGLTKKDGSFWLMDASQSKPNGPRPPYLPPSFRRLELPADPVAMAAGAVHAAGPGYHAPIFVALTRDGEVWTSGMVLGTPPSLTDSLKSLVATLANLVHRKFNWPPPKPVIRPQPWQLPVEED